MIDDAVVFVLLFGLGMIALGMMSWVADRQDRRKDRRAAETIRPLAGSGVRRPLPSWLQEMADRDARFNQNRKRMHDEAIRAYERDAEDQRIQKIVDDYNARRLER